MTAVSRTWFTIVFCLSYVVLFALDWPLFVYYPQYGQFHLLATAAVDLGPPMHWYGLVASAAIAGGLAGLLCKDRWLSRGLAAWLWVAPVIAILGCAFLLKKFFM